MENFNITDFTDCYFTKSREAAKYNDLDPVVIWQIFQKHDAIFCGLKFIEDFFDSAIEVHSLRDGESVAPFEPAMIIKARAQAFVEYETVLLGTLARCTRIATNVRQACIAAGRKPVLFFPARFDVKETQIYDGYAAAVGGAVGCATPMQQNGHNLFTGQIICQPIGTMPHALIAICGGDTVDAALAFAYSRPKEDVWVLVDFHNDCAKTAIEVFNAFKQRGIEDRLTGIRLDTSEKLIDAGLASTHKPSENGFNLYSNDSPELKGWHGVNPDLVRYVRQQLDAAGANQVKIAVSGGFTPEKIALFEAGNVPADVYAVGEGFLKGSNAFTSDIVARMDGNQLVLGQGKVGREYKTTNRLTMMKGSLIPVEG